jgi:hypothetical protein
MTRIVDPEIGFGDQFQRNNIHFLYGRTFHKSIMLTLFGSGQTPLWLPYKERRADQIGHYGQKHVLPRLCHLCRITAFASTAPTGPVDGRRRVIALDEAIPGFENAALRIGEIALCPWGRLVG